MRVRFYFLLVNEGSAVCVYVRFYFALLQEDGYDTARAKNCTRSASFVCYRFAWPIRVFLFAVPTGICFRFAICDIAFKRCQDR